MARLIALDAEDIRFPTSRARIGSDAMNTDPDYSAVYVTLRTDAASGLAGHALIFTIGRGNDVEAAAVRALAPHVVGLEVEPVLDDLGTFARSLTGDSQLRWLGPEGVMQMAIGSVINAAWDMAARRAGLPLWQFVGTLPPAAIVAAIDFRYLEDALTPARRWHCCNARSPGARRASARCATAAIPPTPRRQAGSAIPTRS